MHKRRFNELTFSFAIRPQGPLLIKSGQESGADPTLLDMNFVRAHHAVGGDSTVYLPGSSLKGTLRSYAEKIARTLAEGQQYDIPLSCNPLGNSKRKNDSDYACSKYLDKKDFEPPEKHQQSCPICRTFGNMSIAAHLNLTDAYPINPLAPEDRTLWDQTNDTGQRDGVAIDRVSGAVAHGPFNLEVVTQGAFYGSFTLHNFQLWQLGLLAIVLRDLGNGRVPIGFAKSRGLGRVSLDYLRAEIAYPGRFKTQFGKFDLQRFVYGVDQFLESEAGDYGYVAEAPLTMPADAQLSDDGSYGRIGFSWEGHEAIEAIWRQTVPYWADFVANWPHKEAIHG